MKTYTVARRFAVDVERSIDAESLAEAETKAKELKRDRWLKGAPGATINDWDNLSGTWISEERE